MDVKKGLKSLGSLVWEEDVSTIKKALPAQAPMPAYNPSPAAYAPTSFAPSVAIDPDIRAMLVQSLADKKLPGYDYLRYVAALEEMKAMIPAEADRFRMAFIAAKQLGIDKIKLAESAQHYITVLNEDARDFESNLGVKMQEGVTSKEKTLKDLETSIVQRQAEIQRLNGEIQAAQAQFQALGGEVADSRTKLNAKKQSFDLTLASCVNEIQDNIKKINQYL